MTVTFTLPQKTKALWQIRVVFAAVSLCFVSLLFGENFKWILIFVILFIGIVIVGFYLPRYIKSYKITVDTGFIGISKGVFFKSMSIMPYPRLVYVQSFTTPLSSLFNMKLLLLKASRGWIVVPELENVSCEHLLDYIRVNKND